MFKRLFLLVFCWFLLLSLNAQVLSNYVPLSMYVGKDTTTSPGASPVNTSKISVFASANFSGILTANPATGTVSITDAKPVGNYTITVSAFSASGARTAKTFSLIVKNAECSDGRFNGNTLIPVDRPNLTGLAIADFNGDGNQDLAASHIGYNSVSIYLGDGNGGFIDSTEEGVSSHPYALAVGDFDRDGNQDFMVTNEGANLVAIRLGYGNGTFYSMPNVSVGTGPAGIALADFNNDGKLDFVTANYNSNSVSIRLGDGSGNFSGTTNLPVGLYPESVSVGDFNSDGKQDFVVANSGSNSVSIRLGNGIGGFSAVTDVSVGLSPFSVVVGDFNNDGKQDLAAANHSSNSVSVKLGNGFGGFSGTTEIPVGSGPYCVSIGNFNGDEYPDLATANYQSNTVSIRLGDGNGTFTGNTEFPVGSYPIHLVVGEFNGDNRQDLAIANYLDHTISIRLGMDGVPSLMPIISNSPVCDGQKIEFYSSSARFYTWTGPDSFTSNIQNPEIPVSNLNSAGVYSLSMTDFNNCSATLSTMVVVNPLPVVTFTLLQDSVCTYDPAQTLIGGLPVGGVYTGVGVVGNQFIPSVAGAGNFYLTYTYTDANDCASNDTGKVYVLLCTGIEESDASELFSVYPNPVRELINIDLPGLQGEVSFSLYTLDGKCVRTWVAPGGMRSGFPTGDLSQGVYFLKMSAEDRTVITRVIKVE